jgi:hypothetical protein
VAASGNASSAQVVKGDDSRLGAGMAIGGAVTGATSGSVLFAGADGVLAQDNANFNFDDSTNTLKTGASIAKTNYFGGEATTGFAFNYVIQGTKTSGGSIQISDTAGNIFLTESSGDLRVGASGATGSFSCTNEPNSNGVTFSKDAGMMLTTQARDNASGRVGFTLRTATALTASGSKFMTLLNGAVEVASINNVGLLFAQTLQTQSYTLAALNSAYPSPTVGQRSFITDETTGVFGASSVGGGSLERPVFYGNGAWRNG